MWLGGEGEGPGDRARRPLGGILSAPPPLSLHRRRTRTRRDEVQPKRDLVEEKEQKGEVERERTGRKNLGETLVHGQVEAALGFARRNSSCDGNHIRTSRATAVVASGG